MSLGLDIGGQGGAYATLLLNDVTESCGIASPANEATLLFAIEFTAEAFPLP